MSTSQSDQRRPASSDGRYNLIVVVMLVVIIGLLAVLWMRERTRRITAETELGKYGEQQAAVAKMLESRIPDSLGPGLIVDSTGQAESWKVRLDEVVAKGDVVLDGKQRMGVTITAQAGERLGFAPGDVIIVSPRVTAPATRPTKATTELSP